MPNKAVAKATNPFPTITPEQIEAAKNGLATLASAAKNPNAGSFMRMEKQGVWTLGTDRDEVSKNEKFVVDITSWKTGYIGWDSGTVIEEIMQPLADGPVDETTLDPIKSTAPMDGWKAQVSFEVKDIDADAEALAIRVSFTSKGGRGAAAQLADQINQGFAANPGKTPVITMNSYSYPNKNYGNIDVYVPQYDIVEWI